MAFPESDFECYSGPTSFRAIANIATGIPNARYRTMMNSLVLAAKSGTIDLLKDVE